MKCLRECLTEVNIVQDTILSYRMVILIQLTSHPARFDWPGGTDAALYGCSFSVSVAVQGRL